MTIYEIIKAAISVKQAAKHYGLNVNRNGMACCPFHNDRHPSLKLNEDYFFCFGCTEPSKPPQTGDTFSIALWLALAIASTILLILFIPMKRKDADNADSENA